MTLRVIQRCNGPHKGKWFVKYRKLGSRMERDVAGPCKSEKIAEQRLLAYEQKTDREFIDHVGKQLMAKNWGEINIRSDR